MFKLENDTENYGKNSTCVDSFDLSEEIMKITFMGRVVQSATLAICY